MRKTYARLRENPHGEGELELILVAKEDSILKMLFKMESSFEFVYIFKSSENILCNNRCARWYKTIL